jgi:glutathione S-transferase
MRLYGSDFETGTQKALTVFAEKGQAVELVEVNILKGEDKQPAHLLRHPFGEIPVLEDDGFLLCESRAIIRYLDERLPGPALTPQDSRQRALMEQWISIEQSYFSGSVHVIVSSAPIYQNLWQSPAGANFPPPPDQPTLNKALAEVARVLDVLAKLLERQDYLAGSMFSLAEITWMPYLRYLLASPGGELVQSRPSVASFWQRISTRPSSARIGRVVGQA